jgi:hypothetical protein
MSTANLPNPLWAQLDPTNTTVLGLFANPQPGISNVIQIAATDARVTTFLTAQATPTTITPLALFARFTPAEQQAIAAAAQTNAAVQLWLMEFEATTMIAIGDATSQAGFAELVTLGLLTQARATQIQDLAETSP